MQKKQSIVWLVSSYPRFESDSASIFLRYLAETFENTIYDIHILSPDDQSVDDTLHKTGIFTHHFKYFIPRRLQKLAYGSGILPNLKANPLLLIQVPFFLISQFIVSYRLVKRLKPELIHAHWVFPQGTIACLVGKLSNTPVIITAHGGDAFALQGLTLAKIKHWSLKHCTAWTSNTKATANAFWGDVAQPHIIPMGIDYNKFSSGNELRLRSTIEKKCTILLFVVRLVEKKGVKDLLIAYSLLTKEQRNLTRLWIIGDGSERKSLQQLSLSLEINQQVTFWGKLPNEQLPDYYAAADIFIAPSIKDSAGDTEGQGITLVEAMASETAIISTDTGGISEVIEHNTTGFLISPGRPDELNSAISKLIGDSALRQSMANKAKGAAVNYAWSLVGNRFQLLYEQVKLR